MAYNDLDYERLRVQKDDLLELIREALRKAGLHDLDIKRLSICSGPMAPTYHNHHLIGTIL